MADAKNPVPLYYQLRDEIVQKIEERQWPEGYKLPSEMELCRQFHVSRITIRHTMELLSQEGYIVKKQGVGSFVKYPVVNQNLSSFYSFNDGLKKSGYDPGARVVEFAREASTDEVSAKLQIPAGQQVVRMMRLRLKDGMPLAVETSYVPLVYAEGITAEAVEADGLYRSLERCCGLKPNRAIETFEAVMISKRVQSLLKVGHNTAGMHLERIAYAGEALVEYCDSIICGDKYKFSVELKTEK